MAQDSRGLGKFWRDSIPDAEPGLELAAAAAAGCALPLAAAAVEDVVVD